jgi:hypothetical protein
MLSYFQNPKLLAVGQSLIAVADECIRLAHVRAEARAKVMSIWPALPAKIRVCKSANSRAIKKQDPTGRPLHQAIDTVRHCKSSQMILPNYGSERDTRSHLDRHLSVLAEVWLLSGQPRLGEFEGSNESARRSIPQFRGEWLDLQ